MEHHWTMAERREIVKGRGARLDTAARGPILVRPIPPPPRTGDDVHRFLGIALSATLLLAACKIERTPRQYYAQRTPAATERELFQAELEDRVTAVGPALEREDPAGAAFALAPAPDAYVFGPRGGGPASGPEGVAAMLGILTDTVPAEVRMHEVRVTLGARAQTAWFAAGMEVRRPGEAEGAESVDTLRFTGVYLRTRGEWRLVQAHLSRPLTPPAAPPAPADSAAPEGEAAAAAPPT